MGFFNEDQLATGNNFEAGTSMEPIPEGTSVKAMIDDVKNDSYEGDRYINVRWTVLAPEAYSNRKVFQKIRVYDADEKKADKAKRMLVAIAANTGGGLLALAGEPTDADLQTNLLNKPMVIKLGVWNMNDRTGNWIMAVSDGNKEVSSPNTDEAPWG